MGNTDFRVGLIGTGFMARVRAEVLGQLPGVVLAGICGSSLERAAPVAEELQVEAFPHWRRLVEAELDGIVVSTPNYVHAEQTITALEHGKHVLCEYPLATNMADLQKMLEAAEANRKVLGAGFTSLSRVQQIAEKTRVLGRPTLGYADGLNQRSPEYKWYLDDDISGGMIVLWGIDQIAELCLLMGRVRSVAAFGTNTFFDPGGSKDTFTVLLAFENGATGCVQTGVNSPTAFRTLRAVYENGSVEVQGREAPTIYAEGKEPVRLDLPEPAFAAADTINWVKKCLGEAELFLPIDDVIHYHSVAFAAQEAARSGKIITADISDDAKR